MSEDSPKFKLPKKEIESIFNEMFESKSSQYVRQDALEKALAGRQASARESSTPSNPPDAHTHDPSEFMGNLQKKFKCPDGNCGQVHDNKNYKKSDFYCPECTTALGNADQVEEMKACPTCGFAGKALRIGGEEE